MKYNFKYLKTFENFANYTVERIPLGSKISIKGKLKQTGEVIPWFFWKDATDGTFSAPNKEDDVAIKWADGTKGFTAVNNIVVNHSDDSIEDLGKYIDKDDYDHENGLKKVVFKTDSDGYIEFNDGKTEGFVIFNDKILLDVWHPKLLHNKMIDFIQKAKK